MNRRKWLLGTLALMASSARANDSGALPYLERSEVQEFIRELSDTQQVPRPWLEAVLATGRYSAQAEQLMTPSVSPPPRDWRRYRARVLDDGRLASATEYWLRHQRSLARAEAEFGVPPEIIVAIIGVETRFGRVMGNFRTLDVLLTLSFDYPRRADFFREELAHFLVLGYAGRLDVLKQTGSFAGAIGMSQFMPGSIRQYAVDYDGDGRIELARSAADAIGSVANYLRAQGWLRERPVMFKATANEAIAETLGHGITAERPWAEVADLGVRIDGYLKPDDPVLLLDLPYQRDDGGEGVEYRIGTVNAAAVLHYNRSYFYAAAVADLAAEARVWFALERADEAARAR